MRNISQSYLYNSPKHAVRNDNLQLLRIIRSTAFLRIDFGYHATDFYSRGGWVDISPDTFIRDTKTKVCFTMLRAENIPLAPQHLHFKSTNEWLYFSLYFEPLPESTLQIDLIESEPGKTTDFNFYKIQLNKLNQLSLKEI